MWEVKLKDDEKESKDYRKELWEKVMKKGKKQESGTTHNLSRDDIRTILGTVDFFLKDEEYLKQVKYDLITCKYKVYDWIAMLLDGRDDGNSKVTQVMTYAYLKTDSVEEFIEDLRRTDYQIKEPDITEYI